MDPRGITVPTSDRAVVVGTGGVPPGTEQYQVVILHHWRIKILHQLLRWSPIAGRVYGVSSILTSIVPPTHTLLLVKLVNQFKIIRGGGWWCGHSPSGNVHIQEI